MTWLQEEADPSVTGARNAAAKPADRMRCSCSCAGVLVCRELMGLASALPGPCWGPSKTTPRHRHCKDSLFKNELGRKAKWGTWPSGGPRSVLEQFLVDLSVLGPGCWARLPPHTTCDWLGLRGPGLDHQATRDDNGAHGIVPAVTAGSLSRENGDGCVWVI